MAGQPGCRADDGVNAGTDDGADTVEDELRE